MWKSNKIKQQCFQAFAISVLLCDCTTWTLAKHLEKKLDGDYTRMLHAVFNKSWKQLLYGHLSPISQTIQVKQARHARHCWRSSVTWSSQCWLTSQILYSSALCRYCLEDLPRAMTSKDEGWERIKVISAVRTPW